MLPLAESLTNVALKCNEVWNGSCGYNYPRTGPVTGMISLSLAIRIGCVNESAWGRMTVRSGDRQWSQRIIWVCGGSKQVVHSWRDSVLFCAWAILYVCSPRSFTCRGRFRSVSHVEMVYKLLFCFVQAMKHNLLILIYDLALALRYICSLFSYCPHVHVHTCGCSKLYHTLLA